MEHNYAFIVVVSAITIIYSLWLIFTIKDSKNQHHEITSFICDNKGNTIGHIVKITNTKTGTVKFKEIYYI